MCTQEIHLLMTKNKSSKSLLNPPKRNNETSCTSTIHEEDTMTTKAKKRKKMDVEVSKLGTIHILIQFHLRNKTQHTV